jgi:hypothetical protein
VSFLDGTKPVVDTWDGAVLTNIFSREDGLTPHTPHGTNVDIPFFSKLVPPDPQRDVIGEVCFAVDQQFGLGPRACKPAGTRRRGVGSGVSHESISGGAGTSVRE